MILRSIAREYAYEFGFSIIPVGLDKKSLIDWNKRDKLPLKKEEVLKIVESILAGKYTSEVSRPDIHCIYV